MEKENKKIYKLCPCPAYDVEGMESWLEDLAEQGLFLSKDGFTFDFGAFEKGSPKKLKYRLTASENPTGIFADNMGNPDPEAIEISESMGWKYICYRGDFHIYVCEDSSARELNTDPLVQEIALKAVRSRQSVNIFNSVFWLVIYPFFYFKSGIIKTSLDIGTGFSIFVLFIAIWFLYDAIKENLYLRRLSKKLRENIPLEHKADFKKNGMLRHIKNGIQIAAVVVLVVFSLHKWGDSLMYEDRIPIKEFKEEIPFATISDFVGGEIIKYEEFMKGKSFNSVKKYKDLLAPVNIDFSQQVNVKNSDGKSVGGGLFVDYHQCANPFTAHLLAKEYYYADKYSKNFEDLYSPEADGDFAKVYLDSMRFRTLVYQKGNEVIHAYFFPSYSSSDISVEEWANLMINSINE